MSFKFLTDNTFDLPKLKEILTVTPEANLPTKDDQFVYDQLLQDIQSGDTSLIGAQESHFLNSNKDSIWIPYLIHRWKFKEYPKRKLLSDFPVYLRVEPTSVCNLRCVMCFQVDKSFSSNRDYMGNMDISLFKDVINQAYEGGTKAITLASRGEPFVHPNIGEMLEYCEGKFFELKLNTNATLLKEPVIHQIFNSNVSDLVFSIDSYSKEEYESIRVRGKFEKVLNNIIKVHDIREKYYPNSRTATRISGVQISPKQDIEKFKNFWEKICDHVVIKSCYERWDTYNNPDIPGVLPPCSELWTGMYVWYDGVCNPCDTDYKSKLKVGSIHQNDIRSIWHGEIYRSLREKHLGSKRSSCFPCGKCTRDVPDNIISKEFKSKTSLSDFI